MRNARVLGTALTVACVAMAVSGWVFYEHLQNHSLDRVYQRLARVDVCDYTGRVDFEALDKAAQLIIRVAELDGGSLAAEEAAGDVADKLAKVQATYALKWLEATLVQAEVPKGMLEPVVRSRYFSEIRTEWPKLASKVEWTADDARVGERLTENLAGYLDRFPDSPEAGQLLAMSLEAMEDSPRALRLFEDLMDQELPDKYREVVRGRMFSVGERLTPVGVTRPVEPGPVEPLVYPAQRRAQAVPLQFQLRR